MVTATPFLTQSMVSASGGWPNFPAGRSTRTGSGEDPATTSTSRPVCVAICCATSLIRAREIAFGPVTPPTRTRITLIGSAAGTLVPNCSAFSSAGSADKVVSSCAGWLTSPPMFRFGSRSPPPSALALAGSAGLAVTA